VIEADELKPPFTIGDKVRMKIYPNWELLVLAVFLTRSGQPRLVCEGVSAAAYGALAIFPHEELERVE
jgi:hypothetical protein